MRNITKALMLYAATLAAVPLLSSPVFAGATGITAGDPALTPYTLPYGDFNIVSLQDADTGTGTNNYFIPSSPGQLRGDNAIVVGTGAGGSFANGMANGGGTSTITGIDAPYSTPNGPAGSTATESFTTNTTAPTIAPTQGQFTGDTTGTWNAQVGALNTALANSAPVFYFNLNETGTNGTLSGTDLLLWAKVTVTTAAGAPVGGTYYVAGNPFDPNNVFGASVCSGGQSTFCNVPGGQTGSPLWNNTNENAGVIQSQGNNPLINNGAPDQSLIYPDPIAGVTTPSCTNPALSTIGCAFDPNNTNGSATPQAEEWAYVHGDICVNGSTFLHYGRCGTGDPSGAQSVDQNLGANQAAFAAYNLNLDALLAGLGDSSTDVLHISWEMTDEDNGYEQLFILASGQPIVTPEPFTLSLFGAGLGMLGFVAIRRRKKV